MLRQRSQQQCGGPSLFPKFSLSFGTFVSMHDFIAVETEHLLSWVQGPIGTHSIARLGPNTFTVF